MNDTRDVTLREYLAVVRRRRWVIIIAVLVGIAGALGISLLQTPMYASTTRVLIQQKTSTGIFDEAGQVLRPEIQTEVELQLLTSQRVREAAVERLGYSADIEAVSRGQGVVLQVRAVDPDPDRAAEIADAFTDAYIDVRRENAVDDYLQTAAAIESKLVEVEAELGAVSLAIGEAGGEATPQLARDQATLLAQRDTLQSRLDSLQISADLAQGGGPQVLDQAVAANAPFAPTPVRNALVGAMLGLLVGLALAFVIEQLDDALHSKEEMEHATSGLPTLAMVPSLLGWRNRAEAHIASVEEPSSPTAEAYRTLRTAVQFASIERPMRVLQVTSPRPQDGKTTAAVNLAVVFARAGLRVVIVDCDLRRPRVHDFLGLSRAPGFTSVLLGDVSLAEGLRRTDQRNLVALTAGDIPPEPADLLGSGRAGELLRQVAEACDVLILDSPPVLPVSDALLLSEHADAVVLVASVGRTSRREVARAVEQLRQVDAPLLGSVLNLTGRGRRYTYRYQYGEPDAPTSRRGARRTATPDPAASTDDAGAVDLRAGESAAPADGPTDNTTAGSTGAATDAGAVPAEGAPAAPVAADER